MPSAKAAPATRNGFGPRLDFGRSCCGPEGAGCRAGQPLKPARVDWQNPEQLRFVLNEGKKRQIRRMCEQVGLKVVGLKRVRIGRITLGQLPVGQWRYLAPHERF